MARVVFCAPDGDSGKAEDLNYSLAINLQCSIALLLQSAVYAGQRVSGTIRYMSADTCCKATPDRYMFACTRTSFRDGTSVGGHGWSDAVAWDGTVFVGDAVLMAVHSLSPAPLAIIFLLAGFSFVLLGRRTGGQHFRNFLGNLLYARNVNAPVSQFFVGSPWPAQKTGVSRDHISRGLAILGVALTFAGLIVAAYGLYLDHFAGQ